MNKIFKEFTFPHGKKVRNKIALAPMTTYSSNDDLTLSNEEEIYYNSRSKNIGMVITAATAVSKNAQAFTNQISIRDGRYLESMKRLATSIKKEGALAILQIHHGGRMNQPDLYPNQDIVSASAVKAKRDYTVQPRALKTSEVYDVIDEFCNATRLAIKAGFDGVEIHGANTYLVQQFFSPHSNKRTDEFGGSLEKRLTFPLKLVDRILALKKELNEKEFIVGYRFSPEELETPGITLNHTVLLIDELASKDIDYLHVSLSNYKQTSVRNTYDLEPIVTKLVKVINKRVPLIGAGSIESNEDVDEALSLGYDLVALGMIAIADKDVVQKLMNNEIPSKEISKASLLPPQLYNRIKSWEGIKKRGYTAK
ncbi:NADH oxidase [Candidatus Izimaplasma bacterium HR1]|jgi:2,4-dienoyl-CoA reductase-like NADH-dependent reductase (Old Yellow Enzyme family)|uniref:NADH-dependent flavin oxidoreductase n=1 Tax=Candidatus Izimoplasma sp. HR1 TaxID=1541959 RepID=UPI0004F60889|nr:NADH oxidase [Candidatus Izimaplasma bacterium HR1]